MDRAAGKAQVQTRIQEEYSRGKEHADKVTLSGGLPYYRYKPKYQIEEVKCFIVPRAHRRTAIDGCHHDPGHQGKKRPESYL